MKIKKYSFLLLGIIILIIILNALNKVRKLSTISETCLTEEFNKKFKTINNLKLNSEYAFDEIFNCNKWDEILVVQAPYVNRTLLYLKTGIVLPKYDYINSSEDSNFLFFISDKNVINKPIIFGGSNFIFSNNFKKSNYLKIDREKSNFRYKHFENSYFELYTLELIR